MDSTYENEEYRSQEGLTPSAPGGGDLAATAPSGPPDQAAATPKPDQRKLPYKSAVTASLLSMFPGLGQIYLGLYRRGFLNMVIVACTITALDAARGSLDILLGLFLAFFWLYQIIDAHRRAAYYNQALEGIESAEELEDFDWKDRGSLWGGLVLVVFSVMFLLETKFDVSMEWVEDWWPLVPLGLGLYLIVKSIQSRQD